MMTEAKKFYEKHKVGIAAATVYTVFVVGYAWGANDTAKKCTESLRKLEAEGLLTRTIPAGVKPAINQADWSERAQRCINTVYKKK